MTYDLGIWFEPVHGSSGGSDRVGPPDPGYAVPEPCGDDAHDRAALLDWWSLPSGLPGVAAVVLQSHQPTSRQCLRLNILQHSAKQHIQKEKHTTTTNSFNPKRIYYLVFSSSVVLRLTTRTCIPFLSLRRRRRLLFILSSQLGYHTFQLFVLRQQSCLLAIDGVDVLSGLMQNGRLQNYTPSITGSPISITSWYNK